MKKWLINLYERYCDIKAFDEKNRTLINSCRRRAAYYIDKLPDSLKKYTASQLEEIRKFWAPYDSLIPNNPLTQVVLCNQSGKFDPSYVPFGLQRYIMVRFWNHASFSVFRSKNYSKLLFPFVKSPQNVVTCSYGVYQDEDFNVLTFNAAVKKIAEILQKEKELIIKPALDSGSGMSVTILTSGDTEQLIAQKVKVMSPDFVCQKILKNHPSFSTGENACNTLRVVTLVDDNNVLFVGAVWRMSTGKRVDNWDAGGIVCSVDRNGICGDFAISGNGTRYENHPNGFKFKNHKLFKADEIIETAIKCHKRIMQQKYISWDFTVDEAGDIVFIEMNSPGGAEVVQCVGINSYINKDLAKKLYDKYIYLNKATWKWNYREFSDHVYLLKYFGSGKKVVVPKEINGKKVTLIVGSAFDSGNVTEVIKPDNIAFAVSLSAKKDKIKITEIE